MTVKNEQKGKLITVNFNEILFIEGDGNYVKIWLNNQGKIMTLFTFKALKEILPKEQFIRVNKSSYCRLAIDYFNKRKYCAIRRFICTNRHDI